MGRRIEYRRLANLTPNPGNVKGHDVAGIGDSMDRFGMVELIAVDERTGLLVSGHGRVESLTARHADGFAAPEGVDDRPDGWWVPVVVGWASADDDEALAATIALNQANIRGGWDIDRLLEQLDSLHSNLTGVGFGETDIDDLLAAAEEARARASGAQADDPWGHGDPDRQVRAIMIDLPLDDYRWATATAARARAAFGVDSNAELFTALLREDEALAT
ncbi:MAG: hypothetical protein ACRDXE_08225 [Acidimicrobiales bacterium]